MRRLMVAGKRKLRAHGWEIHRTDPDRSLGEHLWTLFPYLGINCVIDVGAGFGEYGRFLRQNGYAGHIVSFEPVEASFQNLTRYCGNDSRWRAYRYALGRENTSCCINVTVNPAYASLLQPTEHMSRTFGGGAVERTERVDVRRLDEVFDEVFASVADPRVFLKLSTQGWDLEVLGGAERRMNRIVALQSELCLAPMYEGAGQFAEAISSFSQAGFAVSGIFDRPHHHEFRLAEVECVMIRTGDTVPPVVRRW